MVFRSSSDPRKSPSWRNVPGRGRAERRRTRREDGGGEGLWSGCGRAGAGLAFQTYTSRRSCTAPWQRTSHTAARGTGEGGGPGRQRSAARGTGGRGRRASGAGAAALRRGALSVAPTFASLRRP